MRKIVKRSIGYAIRLLLLVLLAAFLFARFDVDAILQKIRETQFLGLFLGYLFFEIGILARTWRWHSITKHMSIEPGPLRSFIVFRIGWLTGIVLPQGWGAISKVLYLRQDGYRVAISSACVIAEKLLDLTTMVTFGLVGAVYLVRLMMGSILGQQLAITTVVVAAVLSLCVLIPLALIRRRNSLWIRERFPSFTTFAGKFGIVEAFHALRNWDRRYLAQLVAGSFIIWMVHAASAFFFLYALGQRVPYDLAFSGFALSGLAVALPFSIDGVGLRETTLATAFVTVGLSGELGIAWGLLISAGSLLSRVAGIPLLFKYPPSFSLQPGDGPVE